MEIAPLLGMELLRLHPLALVDGGAFAPVDRPTATGILLPSGPRRHLHPICSLATLALQARHRAQPMLVEAAARRRAGSGSESDLLLLFRSVIVPGFARLVHPLADKPFVTGSVGAEAIPQPNFPEPALVILGRIWHLKEAVKPVGLSLFHQGKDYRLTGSYQTVGQLSRRWTTMVVEEISRAIQDPGKIEAAEEEAFALRSFRRNGFIEDGDLVVLRSDMALGHVVPCHFNQTLNAICDRNLAVFASFGKKDAIPRDDALMVGVREAGGWRLLGLHRRICLGSRPVEVSGLECIPSDLRLAVFLRFAAFRIAANGRFNEQDPAGELCLC
jgi:hypothetical protein